MRYSKTMIILQLSIISCLITASVSLNYFLIGSEGDEVGLNLTASVPDLEVYRSSGPRAPDFYWGGERVISEPVPGMDVNTKASNYPAVEMDNGTVHFVWSDYNDTAGSGTDTDIFYLIYDGNQWSEVFIVSEPVQGQDNNKDQSVKPDIAVENGEVYIAWEDYSDVFGSGADPDIFYRHFNGSAWSGIMVASEPSQGSDTNKGLSYNPAVDVSYGKTHIVWDDTTFLNGAGTDADIFYRTHDGSTWSNTRIVSEPVKDADINKVGSYQPDVQAENDIVHIVWTDSNQTDGAGSDLDIFYRYYTGIVPSDIEVISEPLLGSNVNDGSSKWPELAVENDDVYVVWEDGSSVFQADPLETEICYRHLTSTGWSTIEVISEPIPGTSVNVEISYNPRLDVENGNVYVVWEDTNNTDGSGTDEDVQYRWFNSNGSKWSRIKVLSEPVSGQDVNKLTSSYPAVSVWHRKVNVVWSDYNNTDGSGTDSDILYRTTFVSPELYGGSLEPSTGLTNTTFTYTVTYSDADNEMPQNIKININGINHQMLVVDPSDNYYYDGKLYFFKTKLNISSQHTYKFTASDGTYEVQTGMMDGPIVFNLAPVITTYHNVSIYEDEYFEDGFEFWDLEHWQSHTWSMVTNASSWLKLDPLTGLISGTPENDDVGVFWVNLSIADEFDEADHINFTITVINVNDAPVISTANQETAYEDELYEVQYQGYDVDQPAQNLIWNFSSNAVAWLNFDPSTLILNGTPGNDDTGIYWVNISLTDSIEHVFSNFTLTAINVNDPPVIVGENVLMATAKVLYSMDYDAYDIDPPPQDLEWRLSTNATPWLDINPINGWLYGIPSKKNVGKYWVNVSVWDVNEGMDFTNFTLTVNPSPNEAPIINFSNVKVSAIVDELYWYRFNSSDDRTPLDDLTWQLLTNATWLALDLTTGNLSGVPAEKDLGWCWANISLHDSENESSYFNFTIYIGRPWSEEIHPPVLRNGELLDPHDEIEFYVFIVQYYDQDGDRPTQIEVVIDNVSHTMWFSAGDPANGEYEFYMDMASGIYTYYFTASDGYFTVSTENFTAEIPGESSGSESEDDSWILIFGAIIVIIIIIFVFIFLLLSQQRQAPEGEPQVQKEPKPMKFQPGREPVGRRSKDDRIRARLASVSTRGQARREVRPLPIRKPAVSIQPVKPVAVKFSRRPVLFEVKNPEPCNVCLGRIKRGLPAIRCTCGKTYHTSCASRAKKCTKCNMSLSNPESRLGVDLG